MLSIDARNVNHGLFLALHELIAFGIQRQSRNGPVLAFPWPVGTIYTNPTERVLFSTLRNANPTFHLVESLWMLAGRRDVAFPATFVKNMKNFSDDGKTFWGAYGQRWRDFFGWDQIDAAINELTVNPESRRVVVSMWNAMDNTGVPFGGEKPDFIVGQTGGKDVPCNTHIYFDRRDGKLNMTVCCRSNDIIWGCYGANAVHMSILQEYMALAIGCPVGWYMQMSNDLHLYTEKFPVDGLMALAHDVADSDLYRDNMGTLPLWNSQETRDDFDDDLAQFFESFDFGGHQAISTSPYRTDFFQQTVSPMVTAWAYRKTPQHAFEAANRILAPDWKSSMLMWLRHNHGAVS